MLCTQTFSCVSKTQNFSTTPCNRAIFFTKCNVFLCLVNSLLLFLTGGRNNEISEKTSEKNPVQERNFLQDVLQVVQNLVITIVHLKKLKASFSKNPRWTILTKCNVFSAWCTVFFQLFLSKKKQKVSLDTNSRKTPCGNFYKCKVFSNWYILFFQLFVQKKNKMWDL